MSSTWTPDIDASHRMLKGVSARSLLGLVGHGSSAVLWLLAILIVGMLLQGSGYASSPLLIVVMALILGDIFLFLTPVVISESVRRRRELNAGYVTVVNRSSQVDQIDPGTGRVVRLAGEDLLTREEYLERIRMIREEIVSEREDGSEG